MPILFAFPVLAAVLVLQTIIVSSLPMLNGYADLVLLVLTAWSLQERVRSAWIWTLIAGVMVGYISALPMMVPVTGYLLVTAFARLIRRRVWQTPILAMFMVTFAGSLITQALVIGSMIFFGTPVSIADSLNLVVFPATLLNVLLALPVYALVNDLGQWLYPEEVEI